MTQHGTVCFISARNLGDAVLHADFLRRLQRAGYARRWVVWTFPQAAFLFESLADCEVVRSSFPMGTTTRSFFDGGYRSFLSGVRRIRSLRPEVTLDIVGDFRERLALRLLGARTRLSAEWETGHPFRRHNRMPPYKPGQLLSIPASVPNLYEAQGRMLEALVTGASNDDERATPVWPADGKARRIGLHPFASAPFKLWPESKWVEAVELMSRRFPGSQFVLFGAPSDRIGLERLGAMMRGSHELFTGSLQDFYERLSRVDLLIGLDSFSVHFAHSRGIPSLVLVGANDPRIFTPPSSRAVVRTGFCAFQPCGGRPKCIGTAFQYACMTSIMPADVVAAVPVARASCSVSHLKLPT